MTKANPCGIAGIASPPVSTLRRPAFFRKLGVPSQSSHGCMVAPSDFAVDLGAMAAMGTFLPSLELFVPWPPWPPWPPASRKKRLPKASNRALATFHQPWDDAASAQCTGSRSSEWWTNGLPRVEGLHSGLLGCFWPSYMEIYGVPPCVNLLQN